MFSKTHYITAAMVGIIALQAFALLLLGQPFACNCGYVKFWDASLGDADNSQHLFDLYSFEHFMYGFVLYFLFWLLRKKIAFPIWIAAIATLAISVGWEIFENYYFVNNEIQANTIFVNYAGDSLLNSTIDTLVLMLGFGLAHILPFLLSSAMVIGLEIMLFFTVKNDIIVNAFTTINSLKNLLR